MESGNAYDLDDDIMDLRNSVGRLKQVSSAIQEENQLTKQVMDGLESAMETARLTLKQTVKRLDRVARKTKSNHVLYVLLFGIALFFIAYFFAKVNRVLRWIF
jgi:protein transport protein SFT1